MTGWKVEYGNTASGSLMIIDEFSQWLAPCEIAQEVESFADLADRISELAAKESYGEECRQRIADGLEFARNLREDARKFWNR